MVLGTSGMRAAEYSGNSAIGQEGCAYAKKTAMADKPKGESFAALFESDSARTPKRRSFGVGEELDVVVVQLGRDAVFVELDGKQEGFIESKDLTNKDGELTAKVGSRITARVVETDGREGAVRLVPVYVRPPAAEEPDADPTAGL